MNRIIPKLEKGEEIEVAPGEPAQLTGDFVVDEKHRNITVTDEGWLKVEACLGSEISPTRKTGRSSITSRPQSKRTHSIVATSST